MVLTYKKKNENYEINDQFSNHTINELLFLKEINDYLSVQVCNLMLEIFCT